MVYYKTECMQQSNELEPYVSCQNVNILDDNIKSEKSNFIIINGVGTIYI